MEFSAGHLNLVLVTLKL